MWMLISRYTQLETRLFFDDSQLCTRLGPNANLDFRNTTTFIPKSSTSIALRKELDTVTGACRKSKRRIVDLVDRRWGFG